MVDHSFLQRRMDSVRRYRPLLCFNDIGPGNGARYPAGAGESCTGKTSDGRRPDTVAIIYARTARSAKVPVLETQDLEELTGEDYMFYGTDPAERKAQSIIRISRFRAD